MSKPLPKMTTDEEAEQFLDTDLSDYITPENFVPVTFEFLPKSERVNLRLSPELLTAVKQAAEQRGISYQKYIREAIELSLKPSSH